MKALLFTYILTYGGAAFSIIHPYTGFLIYVCFAIIKPDSFWWWIVPQGNYSRIVAVALLIGWLLQGCGNWALGRAKGMILAIMGFWAVLLLGAITAPNKDIGWAQVEPMSKVFLPLLVGITLIDSVSKLKQLAWVIVLCQGYLAYEFNLLYYAGNFVADRFNHAGLDNNGIAISMDTSIGLAFFLGIHVQSKWQKVLAFGLAALMAHVVLFSNSRGGMLALGITLVAAFILIPKEPKHYLIFLVAILLVVRLAGQSVQERFMSSFGEEEKGGRRLENWSACWQSMTRHPLGVGPNHWPITAPQYGLPAMAAHSTWLQIGAELGIPGLFCLAAYYGLCIAGLWPMMRKDYPVPDPWLRYFPRMVIASLIGFIVSAQFVTIDGIELPYYIALLGAGALKLAGNRQELATDDFTDAEHAEMEVAAVA